MLERRLRDRREVYVRNVLVDQREPAQWQPTQRFEIERSPFTARQRQVRQRRQSASKHEVEARLIAGALDRDVTQGRVTVEWREIEDAFCDRERHRRQAWTARERCEVDRTSDANGQRVERLTGQRGCLLYTSPSPRDGLLSRMPSSA